MDELSLGDIQETWDRYPLNKFSILYYKLFHRKCGKLILGFKPYILFMLISWVIGLLGLSSYSSEYYMLSELIGTELIMSYVYITLLLNPISLLILIGLPGYIIEHYRLRKMANTLGISCSDLNKILDNVKIKLF